MPRLNEAQRHEAIGMLRAKPVIDVLIISIAIAPLSTNSKADTKRQDTLEIYPERVGHV